MKKPRILIVDDEEASRLVASSALTGLDVEVVTCASAAEALAALATPADAVVLDLMMPGVDGMELCRVLRSREETRDVPVLMLTAYSGRQEKLLALDAGVDDFLAKPVDRLELRTRIAAICRFNRYRRVLEDRQRLDSLVSLSPNGVLVVDASTDRICFANERAESQLGAPLVGRPLAEVLDETARHTVSDLFFAARGGPFRGEGAGAGESRLVTHEGREFSVTAGTITWMGEPALQLVFTEISALRRFEREVHRLERLDTTARLSASVAHDFATVLQVCTVHLQTLSGPAPVDESQLAISEMRHALRRGSQMTRDLLGFSRRGQEAPAGNCDATAVVAEVARLLDALVPLTVKVELSLPNAPCPVNVADYQLEQAVVNLATNARDAMPAGGVLSISVSLSARGDGWVEVTVRDTGCGMDPRVRSRLGEPFVSTKPEGQGTGLGFWSVRRMVEGANGTWSCESEPGMGTAVHLQLPPAVEGYIVQAQ